MTTTQQLTSPAATSQAVSLLQRVILPRSGDLLDLRALYLDENKSSRRRFRATSRRALELRSGSSSRILPLPSMAAVKAERFMKPPTNPVTIGATLTSALVHNLLPVKAKHHRSPQLNVAAKDARWFLLARLDGATVATADGRGVAFRKRNPKIFWSLLGQSVRSHAELRRKFPHMRKIYARGLADLTPHESWRRVFDA